MKKIKLTKGLTTLVDDCDYDWLNKYQWYKSKAGYVSKKGLGYMHRLIMGTPKGMDTDHINGNRLDNRRLNLRICDRTLNNFNKEKPTHRKFTSRYKGVCWREDMKKWSVYTSINKKTVYLGSFKDEKQAALAYNEAAKKHFGEFARLNEI